MRSTQRFFLHPNRSNSGRANPRLSIRDRGGPLALRSLAGRASGDIESGPDGPLRVWSKTRPHKSCRCDAIRVTPDVHVDSAAYHYKEAREAGTTTPW